ncbi:MAG: Hpt domain-containing protein [Paracoccaceae bacterium]
MNMDLEARIAAIREKFLNTLEVRLAEVEAVRADLSVPQSMANATRDMRFVSHKLRGVASTLGFERLGELAEAAELQAEAVMDSGPDAASLPALSGSLEDLRGEIRAIMQARA